MTSVQRFTIELHGNSRKKLERLRILSESRTTVETIRKSIATYELLLDHIEAGGAVILEHESGKRERLRLL